MTVFTDFILGLAAVWFAFRLWRAGQPAWALAFVFTAVGSFLGGTYHAFLNEGVWRATVYAVGLASMFLLIGAKPSLTALAIIKFMIYASWMVWHDDFMYVIIDYGISLLIVAILQTSAWLTDRAESAPWIVGSICVSVVGALLQQMEVGFGPRFNHNDVYHVIQLFALWLLYRGGVLLNRKSPQDLPTTQPT